MSLARHFVDFLCASNTRRCCRSAVLFYKYGHSLASRNIKRYEKFMLKDNRSVACGLSLAASLLIRSAGIALLAGLIGWLVVSFFADKTNAMRRLKIFL